MPKCRTPRGNTGSAGCGSTGTRTVRSSSGVDSLLRPGAVLIRALEAGREHVHQQARRADDPSTRQADPPTTAQENADALVLLAETALNHDLDPGAPGERYQVVVQRFS